MKKHLSNIFWLLLLAAVVSGLIYLDYLLWKAEHPGAPFWTFIFGD
jgi:hypothetical protein